MRGFLVIAAALSLAAVAVSRGAVPPATPNIYGKWHMRGVVVRSSDSAQVGRTDRSTWTLRTQCAAQCTVQVRLGGRGETMLLSQAGTGTRYRGQTTNPISCASGQSGTSTKSLSLHVTAARLSNAHIVATQIVAYLTTRVVCPNSTRSSVRRYRGAKP